MRKDVLLGVYFAVSSLMLGGCGGGGGGGSLSGAASFVPPVSSPALSSSATATSSVAISLAIPNLTTAAVSRSLKYISTATKSMAISVNGGAPNVANCAATCSTVVTTPIGNVTFLVKLYDASNGMGNILSTGTTTAVVLAGQSNNLSLTLNGVASSVSVILGSASVTSGTSATIPVSVVAKDSAGNIIVGGEPYATPIALAVSDSTGAVALSTASLTAPNATVSLSYNGSAAFTGATISASIAGGSSGAAASARLAVAAPPSAIVPANIPQHIAAMYYYGLNGVNTQIPPAFMAAHADYVESDLGEGNRGTDYKNAGGKHSLLYTDPNYVPYCQGPFTPPAATCRAAMGDAPESAWFHGADGTRIRHQVGGNVGYQESLNPTSPAAQAAWHAYTTQLATSAPATDYFFADDSGGDLKGGDFFGFNAPEVEVTNDAQWLAGRLKLFEQATRPLIINGIGSDGMPAYNGGYLDNANVAGLSLEGCFSSDDAGRPSGTTWARQANGLLATYAHHKLAVCMSTGTQTPANRIYYLASYWTIYDPVYTVAGSVITMPDGYVIDPAFDIVPRDPIASASADVAVLKSANGTYVREFAHCYQGGKLIGRCASVVNTTQAPVSTNALVTSYSRSLVLSPNSSYTDGTATWSAQVPAQIPATSAIVLAQ